MLETLAMDLGVKVDGVLAGDNVGESRTGLALRGVLSAGHCWVSCGREGKGER